MYSLKYSGIENPKKRATPVIKRFLIEFMLVNCKNDSPTEAERQKGAIVIKGEMKHREAQIKSKVQMIVLTHKAKQNAVYSSKNREGD